MCRPSGGSDRVSRAGPAGDVYKRQVFNIHGSVIQKVFFQQVFKHFRPGPVGVQLYQESQIFYLSDKIRKIRLQRGFSACDADAFQNPFSPGKKCKDIFLGINRGISGREKLAVMAVGAAEITALSLIHI